MPLFLIERVTCFPPQNLLSDNHQSLCIRVPRFSLLIQTMAWVNPIFAQQIINLRLEDIKTLRCLRQQTT